MAKYKAYPEYKDSGVEWLGEIPTYWQTLRGKYVFKEVRELSTTGDETLLSVSEYYGVKPRQDTIEDGDFISRADSLIGYKKCQVNDLAMNIMLAWKTGLGVSNYDGIISPAYSVFRFDTAKAQPEYMHYLLRTKIYTTQFKSLSTGVIDSRLRLYPETFGIVEILLPSLGEQKKICAFLSHETAKIDNLIEKQQQLIELLKEKRQAVISHAVTKGLNPDVPMKDSGVDWLGEVPEHWIPARLKYHTRQIVDGAHFTPTYTEKGIPFLRVTDIQDKYIDFDNIKFIPEHEHKELIKRCRPENGDLLLSKNGTIGVPKLVDWDWEFSIFVSLCLIKFKGTLTPEYSEFYFKSHEIKEQVFGLIKQSTVINLHLDKIQNFWFCIPPLEEQYKIVNYLNEKIDTLECLIESAELTIRLAQERRTALISAAVTGKIDVRDWVIPDTQDVEELQESTV
ncbi:hypothetical protein BHC43_04195 [Snodgrassella alvi]|uniref:restriction endonuclease subunit S n=1 Tax=Snodgrassella alvi TaxID=1196083 RepID=UPI000C1EFC79|nr:restriction endonuclease subunit S [Snodgrassella alvi]PIT38975.1 hypothetical protein BHC43_04195 [Snodgrassella alvi]